ncbi:ATP-binding protein [Streptomyces sp. NPDC051219]|uniref:ATP-binding protein n=1 Tax=Streptomyces sp. NPDC051219 TaxID=3155283 RepID=UPI0034480813
MAIDYESCMERRSWELPFLAEPQEVVSLRRVLRLHMTLWGLSEVVETAQICVTELVSNVIQHVGSGTPTTLAVSMNGPLVRVEIRDPDTRALPTLLAAHRDAESGRGLALVNAAADRWGVILRDDHKVVWCELATCLTSPNELTQRRKLGLTEGCSTLYGGGQRARRHRHSPLEGARTQEAAIDLIADVLHWLRARGFHADEVLDHAQMRFEASMQTVE